LKQSIISPVLPDFRDILQGLVGKPCWDFAAGPNTGSHVSFDFGRKLRIAKPLRIPGSPVSIRYTGEIHLFVTCSWRLDSEKEVLCGAEDDNTEEGPMRHGLRQLLDRRVSSVQLREPGLDLVLEFEGGLTLRVFCDEVRGDGDDNYTVFVPGCYYNVGKRSVLTRSSSSIVSIAELEAVPSLV
jgi:hypothetical protein